jgi:trigger factor
LKIDTLIQEDHQAKLTVEIEDERLEEMKHKAASKLSVRVKIPGFRPGKAPYPVVVRTVGEPAIYEEALDMLVDSIYPEVIKEAGIKPYSAGRVNKISDGQPLKLEILVPLEAEVKLGDYKSIRIPYELKTVSDEEVDEVLESLREQNAIIEPVERPVAEGDIVTVQLDGNLTDGDNEEELIRERSVPILAKQDSDDDWPFPGFSTMLLKKSVGSEAELEYVFPDDYSHEDLRGKKATFHYKVENVKSRVLPELNDDFATSLSEFANLEELKSNARSMLEKQAEETYQQTYEQLVIDKLIESSEFKYSPQMLDSETHSAMHDLEDRLAQQGVDMEIYMKSRKLDQAGLEAELKPAAEKRLKRSLTLFEIGKVENIHVDKEELEREVNNTLNYLQRSLPEKEARRLNEREVQNNVMNNVMVDLIGRKTLAQLRDIASGKLETEAKIEQEPGVASVQETGDQQPATDTTEIVENETSPDNKAN